MLSGFDDGRHLVILEFLRGLDHDDERRRAGPRLSDDSLNLIGMPCQLLRSQYREDHLAGQRLEIALVVRRRGLDENLMTPDRRWRCGVKLPLDSATARNLDEESRLLRHRARLSPPGKHPVVRRLGIGGWRQDRPRPALPLNRV